MTNDPNNPPAVLLLGAGNMGGALFAAWVAEGRVDPARSAVVDPTPSDAIADLCAANGIALNPAADGSYDVCVLAVKPQMFASVLPDLDWPGIADTLFVSIAAGVTTHAIGQMLAERAPGARIIRTMPSLPAQIGQSVTLAADASGVSVADKQAVTALMEAAGEVYWCDDEDHLDRLMGVTGCSPAFVFLLAEALAEAAVAEGVGGDDARRIAEASVTGAAALLARDTRPAAALRQAVTSPNGTTEAALRVLNDERRGLKPLIGEAVRAAYDRARELAAS